MHGNIVSAKFTQKKIRRRPSSGLAKHPFETNELFFLIVILWMLRRCNILNASAQRLMNTKTKSAREIASLMRERLECLLGRYAPCGGNKQILFFLVCKYVIKKKYKTLELIAKVGLQPKNKIKKGWKTNNLFYARLNNVEDIL